MEPAPAQEQAHTQVAGEAGAAARLVAHMWIMVALKVAELAAPEMAVSPPQRSAMRTWTADAARSLQRSAMLSLLVAEVADPNQSACPRYILPGFFTGADDARVMRSALISGLAEVESSRGVQYAQEITLCSHMTTTTTRAPASVVCQNNRLSCFELEDYITWWRSTDYYRILALRCLSHPEP